jgi:hypothetical protein
MRQPSALIVLLEFFRGFSNGTRTRGSASLTLVKIAFVDYGCRISLYWSVRVTKLDGLIVSIVDFFYFSADGIS